MLVKNDIVTNLKKCGKLNLSKDTFYQLLYNDGIAFRPADKGLSIVVIEKENFIQSLQQEIEQCNLYAEIEFDLTKDGHKKVKKVVNKMVRDGTATKEMHR